MTGVPPAEAQSLLASFKKIKESPLIYHHNGRALASLIFIWLGYPFVVYSTIIMWLSLAHYRRTGGPFSTHAREAREGSGKDIEIGSVAVGDDKDVPESQAYAAAPTPMENGGYDGTMEMPPSNHAHNVSDTSSRTAVSGGMYDPTYQPSAKGSSRPVQPYPGT